MERSSYRNDTSRRVKVGLIILAVPTLVTGLWAVFAPASWYADYTQGIAPPRAFGSYNEHFVQDLGSGYLGVGVVLVVAAIMLTPAVVTAAVLGFTAFTLPHLIVHLVEGGDLDAAGYAFTTGLLAGGMVLAIWVWFLSRRAATAG
ncbi:MAG TPA: hypothetical protein VGB52_08520 [Actinomycetota bacterium]